MPITISHEVAPAVTFPLAYEAGLGQFREQRRKEAAQFELQRRQHRNALQRQAMATQANMAMQQRTLEAQQMLNYQKQVAGFQSQIFQAGINEQIAERNLDRQQEMVAFRNDIEQKRKEWELNDTQRRWQDDINRRWEAFQAFQGDMRDGEKDQLWRALVSEELKLDKTITKDQPIKEVKDQLYDNMFQGQDGKWYSPERDSNGQWRIKPLESGGKSFGDLYESYSTPDKIGDEVLYPPDGVAAAAARARIARDSGEQPDPQDSQVIQQWRDYLDYKRQQKAQAATGLKAADRAKIAMDLRASMEKSAGSDAQGVPIPVDENEYRQRLAELFDLAEGTSSGDQGQWVKDMYQRDVQRWAATEGVPGWTPPPAPQGAIPPEAAAGTAPPPDMQGEIPPEAAAVAAPPPPEAQVQQPEQQEGSLPVPLPPNEKPIPYDKPKTKSELVVGRVYGPFFDDDGGAFYAQWDGQQFVRAWDAPVDF